MNMGNKLMSRRSMRFYAYLLIPLFAIILLQNTKTYAEEESGSSNMDHQVRFETYRVNHFQTNELMELLNIEQGMTVLDIGTGTGQYAYRIAEELEGTGKVYATDVHIELIDYVTEEASRRGFSNIYPVLVKEDGLDDFYFEQKYDLILIFHLYCYIQDRGDYFGKIKSLLNKDGRLFVSFNVPFCNFLSEDFTDFDGLIKELKSEPETSPFIKGLQDSTRELLKQNSNERPSDLLKIAIVNDFNRMRKDPHFREDFLTDKLVFKKNVFFSPRERDYATTLLLLSEVKSQRSLAFKEKTNKLLIVQRFRKYLYQGASIPPYEARSYSVMNKTIKVELKEAGYKFEHEYMLEPFEFVLVFAVNDGNRE